LRIDVIKVNYQPDCIFIDTSDKVDCKIEVLPMEPILQGYERAICILKSSDSKTLTKTFEYMSKYPRSKNVRIISKDKKTNTWEVSLITNTTKLYGDVRYYGGFVLGTMSVKDGKEEWIVTFEDPVTRSKAIEVLKDTHEIDILKSIEVPSDFFAWLLRSYEDLGELFHSLKSLSLEQKRLLKKLVEKEYYSWPRRITITKLAEEYGVTKAAMSRRVRTLEKSIIENVANLIAKNL